MWILMLVVNFIVGGLIGISGIGGFFLPIAYTALAGVAVRDALLLSFSAFIVSGLVGTIRYSRMGYIRGKDTLWICIGCFTGAMLGVFINYLLPVVLIKMLLYTVMLLAGLSLLRNAGDGRDKSELLNCPVFLALMGFLVGTLCSMSGAGGALILVPVLVALGEPARHAVGIGILGSLIISIPSSAGYFLQTRLDGIVLILAGMLLMHGLGVYVGSRFVNRINQEVLKKGIAYFSIASSLFLMFRLL